MVGVADEPVFCSDRNRLQARLVFVLFSSLFSPCPWNSASQLTAARITAACFCFVQSGQVCVWATEAESAWPVASSCRVWSVAATGFVTAWLSVYLRSFVALVSCATWLVMSYDAQRAISNECKTLMTGRLTHQSFFFPYLVAGQDERVG